MRALLFLSLLLLAVLGGNSPAGAHAVLLEAWPADGARLAEPPSEIELLFNEPVLPIFVRLFDARGDTIPGAARLEAADTRVILWIDSALPNGTYLVSWRVTSLDSHPVGGTTSFTVGEAAPTRAASSLDADEGAWRWPNLIIRAAHYGLVLLAAGLVLSLLILRPPSPVAAAARRWAVLACGLALATAVLRIGAAGLELALLSPLNLLTAEPWRLAFGVPVGTAMATAVLGLGGMLLGLLLPSTARPRTAILAAGTAVALLSFALSGHVLTIEPPWLGPPLIMLHASCAAFWVGALLPLRAALDLAPSEAAGLMTRFSKLAALFVTLLLIAGFALAWLLVGEPRNLVATGYGLRLLSKLALVAGMLVIAGLNLLLLTSWLERAAPNARGWLRTVLAIDLCLAAGVVVMTASLELDPPPGVRAPGPQGDQHPVDHHGAHGGEAPRIWTTRLAARGYQVMLGVAPAKAGPNRVKIAVSDVQGQPVDPVAIDLIVSLPEAGIEQMRVGTRRAGQGSYVVPELNLLRAGRWAARLDLLIDDFTKVTLSTEIPVD